MKKIANRIVTDFFVFVFGVLWFFSIRYQVKPDQYNIIVYDVLGKQVKLDGIRTSFKTKEVATSFLKEYKNRFTHYEFSIAETIPEFRRRLVFSKILRNQR